MSKATDFYRGMQTAIDNAIKRVTPFRARVHDTMDGKVQIQTLDGSDPLDEPFARLAGPVLTPDDEVAVIELSGKPFVLGKVQRATPTGRTYEEPVTVRADHARAFRVIDVDGTERFVVDTDGFKVINVLNDTAVEAWDSNGQNTWYIGATGEAYLRGTLRVNNSITATTYNSPQVFQRQDVNPVTSSTTNTATFVEVQTLTCNLPEGTWSLFVFAYCNFKRNGAGLVDYRLTFNGATTPTQNVECVSGSWTGTMTHRASHGHSGTTNVRLEYKGAGASTSSARNFSITALAVRTA